MRTAFLMALLALSACTASFSSWDPYRYVVRKGDNLYQIAWQYRVSVDDLLSANNLNDASAIYPGQKLQVRLKQKNDRRKTTPQQKPPINTSGQAQEAWRPPLDRVAVLHPFSTKRSGLFLQAPTGTAVRASASGLVVYVGNAIRAYGLLVIVKHPNQYLSAYGFLDAAQTKEGQRVTRGQVIGTSGSNLSAEQGIHFEIRDDGRAINPARVLGKKIAIYNYPSPFWQLGVEDQGDVSVFAQEYVVGSAGCGRTHDLNPYDLCLKRLPKGLQPVSLTLNSQNKYKSRQFFLRVVKHGTQRSL